MKITEASKLPAASVPWARQVTDGVNDVDSRLSNFLADQTNQNRATAANTGILTNNNKALADQIAYLQSLQTVSATGSDFLINNIPGDQTNRWYDGSGDTVVTVNVPTGRLLVGWGAGSVESRAGNSTMYAMLRISLSAPSGWATTIGGATRSYVTGGTTLGLPFASERTIDVPVDEPITVRVQFGTWSAGTTTLASASFFVPFIRAQVIPAATA